MHKVILYTLILFTLSTLSHAKIMDGIALIVEGEIVTTAEIDTVQTQFKVSKKKAIDILIQDRLQKTAMKDIFIEEKLIDEKTKAIAAQNKISLSKMRKILLDQGTPWMKYRNTIREALKKERFFQEKVLSSIPNPTEEELKLFYKHNKKEFVFPKYVHLREYTSKKEETLKKFIKTGKKSKIKSKSVKKLTSKTDSALLSILLSAPKGQFTRIINGGNNYVVYKILSKSGKVHMPFDTVKELIANKWKRKQQDKSLKDYFGKLRTRAEIQILR